MNKQLKWGIATSVILLLFVLGVTSYFQYTKTRHIVKEKEVNLTADQRKIYEDRLADAEKRLQEAQSDEERYNVLVYQGYQHYGLGKYSLAVNSYTQAIDLNPEKSDAYAALYQTQLDMKDYDGARESINNAVAKFPNSSDLWNKRIMTEKELFGASNDTLKQMYETALTQTNNSIDVVTPYAQFLELIGQIDSAIQQWKKALEVNPSKKNEYDAEITRLQKLIQ